MQSPPQRMALSRGNHTYSEENVRLAISKTIDLRRLAMSRGLTFNVLIIPTLEEVQSRAYSWPTAQYVKGLGDQNIQIVPLIQSLSYKDYFLYDGHFNSDGARVAAEAIYRNLKSR